MTAGVLGGYRDVDSALNRLDARVKLALLLFWTMALFHIESWWALALLAVVSAVLAERNGIALARFATGLKPLLVVLAVIVASSALRFDGSGAWALAGGFGVSPGGLAAGLLSAARIVLMVGFSLLVTASTPAERLTEAFAYVMGPLRRAHVPVDDIAMMFSIAVRFIPVCSEQLERVALAQRARGARLGRGNIVQRVVSWVPVMIPVCVNLFRRAEALAAAMDARCYRGEGRTRLTSLEMRPVDAVVLAVGAVACVATALLA